MRHLPKFQPPSFTDGPLPCPDSPDGTPRDDEKDVIRLVPSQEVRPDPYQGSNLGSRVGVGMPLSEGYHAAAPQPQPQPQPQSQPVTQPVPAPAQAVQQRPAEEEASRAAQLDPRTGRFLPGTFVEYKSRTSGQWILAKVDSFDEKSNTYRLDVQPHAHPDRVRARQGNNSATANGDRDRASAPVQQAANDGVWRDENHGSHRPAVINATSVEAHPSLLPAYTQPMPTVVPSSQYLAQDRERPQYEAQAQVADRLGEQREATPLQTAALQNVAPLSTLSPLQNGSLNPNDSASVSPAMKMLKEVVPMLDPTSPREDYDLQDGSALGGERLPGPDAEITRCRAEADALRRQVARLQTENGVLKERLSAEAALKDRYFAELCICNEQLQRLRATPR